MRRRNTGRQKPWNKPKTEDKFWSFPNGSEYSGAPSNFAAGSPVQLDLSHTPQVVAAYKASALMGSNSTVTDGRDRQTCKIHRFDGALLCWLDANPSTSLFVAPTSATDPANPQIAPEAQGPGLDFTPGLGFCNIGCINYWWFKYKSNAAAYNVSDVPAATYLNPSPLGELSNILLRRDVLKWGHVLVHGIVPRMFTGTGVTGQKAVMQVGNAGMWLGPAQLSRIPFPRLPKVGLNLKEDEMLVCVAAHWEGPVIGSGDTMDDSQVLRPVNVYNMSRVLCSG